MSIVESIFIALVVISLLFGISFLLYSYPWLIAVLVFIWFVGYVHSSRG